MRDCKFRIIVGRHPADGVRLALRLGAEGSGGELVLVPAGGENCSLQFGFAVPPDYPGVTGLLRYRRDSLVTEVEWSGGKGRVVFPPTASSHATPMAEVLDRIRERLADEGRATVFIMLDRFWEDLPPLGEGDSVLVLWEARDRLCEGALAMLRGLSEAVGSTAARLEGFRLYHRREPGEVEQARVKEIEEALGSVAGPPLSL
ncbi:MAG TPA: hypothetical protein PLU30_23975 [Verrucomicrobiae bacterium]|nr:hypothetical protein [Verrucomicrobiae bacterium]